MQKIDDSDDQYVKKAKEFLNSQEEKGEYDSTRAVGENTIQSEKVNDIGGLIDSYNLKEKSKDPVFAEQVLRNTISGLMETKEISDISPMDIGRVLSDKSYREEIIKNTMIKMFFENNFSKVDKNKQEEIIKEIMDAGMSSK